MIRSFNPSPELDSKGWRMWPRRWEAEKAQRGQALDLSPWPDQALDLDRDPLLALDQRER